MTFATAPFLTQARRARSLELHSISNLELIARLAHNAPVNYQTDLKAVLLTMSQAVICANLLARHEPIGYELNSIECSRNMEKWHTGFSWAHAGR